MNPSSPPEAPDIREIRSRDSRAKTRDAPRSRRVLDCFRQIGEEHGHLRGGFQIALVVDAEKPSGGIEGGVIPCAGEEIEHAAPSGCA